MTFWEGDKNKKPERWAFDKSLVDPKWEWMWNNLEVGFPFWEGGVNKTVRGFNSETALTTNPSTGGSGWKISSKGAVFRCTLASTSDFFTVQDHPGISGANPRSCVVYANTTLSGTSSRYFMSWGTTSAGTAWRFCLQDGNLRVEVGSGNVQGNTAVDDGEWHLFSLVLGGTDVTDSILYIDGKKDSVLSSVARAVNTTSGTDVKLFSKEDSLLTLEETDVSYALIFNTALSQGQISQLARDPFGPFRMDAQDELMLLGVVGAPPSGRVMSSLAGYGGLAGHGGIAGAGGGLAA